MTDLFTGLGGTLRPLRPHQEGALEALRASLAAGKRRPMLQAPTGAGKTLLAAHIIQRALDKGNRVIFTVPALSLIDQTVAAFEAEGIQSVGVMQGIHERTDPTQPVQVCTVQTLARRLKPGAELVLIDEAHIAYQALFRWMDGPAWEAIPFIGLSATPWTRGLGKHFDDLIIATTTAELIEQGYLSRFVVYAPSTPDLSGVRTVAGDFHEGELGEAMNMPALVGDIIETWMKRGENRPTLCYGVNRAHAEHLQQRFVEAGIAAEYIDCFTDRMDRERIFDRFRAGDTRVICNVATLTTGLDLDVRCIVDAKPTKSDMLFVQTIGRGLRTAPGKDRCVILDHAGNHLRLGLVTDIHYPRLDDGKMRRGKDERSEGSEPLPRLCEQCKAVLPPRIGCCPECGHVREARSAVEHVDGELVELGSRATADLHPTIADKTLFYSELRGYGILRGYAKGWASHKYREKFGVWPNDPRIQSATPASPSLRTKQWILSRQIAHAKGVRRYG